MSTPLRVGLATTVIGGLLLCAANTAFASPSPDVLLGTGTSSGEATLAELAAVISSQSPATDFLTQAIDRLKPAATGSSDGTSIFTQSRTALRNPLSSQLRGNSDLVLWNLVALVRSQQRGAAFDLVDTGVAALQLGPTPTISAVPLPGAVWLFVMGVLGLAGTRLTGGVKRSTRDTTADRRTDGRWPSDTGLVAS